MRDDDQLRLIRFQHAPRDSFEEYPKWRTDCQYKFGKEGDAVLIFVADNPDLLTGQDPDLMGTTLNAYLKHRKTFGDLITTSAVNWLAIAAPVDGWTDKVFPDLPPNQRKAKFWDSIFEICQ